MKTQRKKSLFPALFRFLLAAVLLLSLSGTAWALDDDEFGGYTPDTLSVRVGYPGGPYYEKHLFTLAELEKMNVVYADYTFIDSMPSVIIDHVKGVRLADIIDSAGIDLGSVKTFDFWIRDKKESSYTSFSKASLIDTPRYCYYSLPDNFDYDEGTGNKYATSNAQPVDTVMALADDWNRCIAGATFGSDYLNLNANTRFRLIFGQRDAAAHTATSSAKWVYAIVAEVTGTPRLALNCSAISLSSGGTAQLKASVTAADPLIAEKEPVAWSSGNKQVAAVDEHGTVTANAKGTAVITAEFHGVSASAIVTVTAVDPKSTSSGNHKRGTGGVTASGRGGQTGTGGISGSSAGTSKKSSHTKDLPAGTLKQSVGTKNQVGQMSKVPKTVENNRGSKKKPASPLLSAVGMAAICLFAGGALLTQMISRIRAKHLAGKTKK